MPLDLGWGGAYIVGCHYGSFVADGGTADPNQVLQAGAKAASEGLVDPSLSHLLRRQICRQ
jgi:hypothetical protein